MKKEGRLAKFYWSVECDLVNDFRKFLYRRLLKEGYTKDILSEQKDLIIEYFKHERNKIVPCKRKVIYSQEFSSPREYQQAINEFVQKVEMGKDVSPYMSTNMRNLSNNDLLLNDWGIHHFHLTRRFNADGTAKRSDYQIFAYVTHTTMYFLQVYPHNMPYVYSKQELLKIIYRNWPEIMEQYKLQARLTEDISDEKYDKIRKKHMMSLVEIEGNIYFSLGGGYASDGSSNDAVRKADWWHNRLKTIELQLCEDIKCIFEMISSVKGISSKREMKLSLYFITLDVIKVIDWSNLVIISYWNEGKLVIQNIYRQGFETDYFIAQDMDLLMIQYCDIT